MMLKKCLILLCVFVPLVTGLALAAEITGIEELEKRAMAKMKDVQSMKTDFTQLMTMGDQGKMEITGTMFFQFPNKMKVEFNSELMKQNMKTTVVNDGQYLWTETNMGGQFTQVFKTEMAEMLKFKKLSSMPGINVQDMHIEQIFLPFKSLRQSYTFKWLGKQTIEAGTYYVVEATITEEGKKRFESLGASGKMALSMGGRQKLFCDLNDGFVRRMILISDEGYEAMAMTFDNVVINPELASEFFTYTAPENVKVLDFTPMVKQMMQNLENQSTSKTETEADDPETQKTKDEHKQDHSLGS